MTQAQQQVADEQAQIALANGQAIQETDKMIFTPEGVFPNLIFNKGAVLSFNGTHP